MKSDEVRLAEAIAALTARLEAWNVEDPAEKAQAFMVDMLHHGWRPRALATVTPIYAADAPPPDLSDVRSKLKADAEEYQAKVRALRDSARKETS